jgi:hypothetical protein
LKIYESKRTEIFSEIIKISIFSGILIGGSRNYLFQKRLQASLRGKIIDARLIRGCTLTRIVHPEESSSSSSALSIFQLSSSDVARVREERRRFPPAVVLDATVKAICA